MTQAGWYPDPSGIGGLRYFDGAAWTEHVQAQPQQAPGTPAPAKGSSGNVDSRRRTIVVIGVIAVGLLAGYLAIGRGSSDAARLDRTHFAAHYHLTIDGDREALTITRWGDDLAVAYTTSKGEATFYELGDVEYVCDLKAEPQECTDMGPDSAEESIGASFFDPEHHYPEDDESDLSHPQKSRVHGAAVTCYDVEGVDGLTTMCIEDDHGLLASTDDDEDVVLDSVEAARQEDAELPEDVVMKDGPTQITDVQLDLEPG